MPIVPDQVVSSLTPAIIVHSTNNRINLQSVLIARKETATRLAGSSATSVFIPSRREGEMSSRSFQKSVVNALVCRLLGSVRNRDAVQQDRSCVRAWFARVCTRDACGQSEQREGEYFLFSKILSRVHLFPFIGQFFSIFS